MGKTKLAQKQRSLVVYKVREVREVFIYIEDSVRKQKKKKKKKKKSAYKK